LTGALVIDRARGLGYCGLSERCDAEGARLMHEAFGLRATLLFDLAPGEYHTNVVLAVLAGRAAVVCPRGFADAVEASAHLEHVDGAMLGRAAYHTPYLLHELDVAWFGGELESRGDLLRAYRPYVEAQLEHGVQLKHIVRHVLGLFAGQPGGRGFRQVLSEGAHKDGADWSLVERALALTEREREAA
jgi:hypothetical protein